MNVERSAAPLENWRYGEKVLASSQKVAVPEKDNEPKS